MRELVKISNEVIGVKKINSVKGRELYKALGITKHFSQWIENQIKRAGLRENIEYIMFDEKVKAGNGSTLRKEYAIDAKSAKHIAMMSQGKKAEAVRDYFIQLEEEYELLINNPNIHELSGRVGGLTTANNKLRKEVDKLKKKVKRIDNLEIDVDDLKYQQKLLPNKTLDEKLEVVFQKSDILNSDDSGCFWQDALQKSNKFYIEYIKVLKGDGNELQRWATNQIAKKEAERNEFSKQRLLSNHRYEVLLEKIKKMQEATSAIVNFDIENEMRYVDID